MILKQILLGVLLILGFILCFWWNVLAHRWYGNGAPLTFLSSGCAALFLAGFVMWVGRLFSRGDQ